MEHILFITDAWGPLYGGINSFNYDLSIALSKIIKSNIQVVCTTNVVSRESEKEADKYNIKLLKLNSNLSSPKEAAVDIIKENLTISHIFCHDYISGGVGIELSEINQEYSNKLFSFHHMNPEVYDPLKSSYDPIATNEKRAMQLKLFKKSKLVFCVGPKLRDSAVDKIGKKDKVIELIPGLAQTSQHNTPTSYFRASIIGRISKRIDKVKQYELGLAACAIVDSKDHLNTDSIISLIGVEESENQETINNCNKILEKYNAKSLKLNAINYLTNREQLFDEIKRQSVAFMLSAHEGFGLVGWEAISAEVPLILGENTGLFQLLKERFGGFGIGNVLPVDIRSNIYSDNSYNEEELNSVVNSLIRFIKNKEFYKKNAQILKNYLEISFTWENCAYDFASAAKIETKTKNIDRQKFSLPLLNILNIVKGINKRDIQYDILEDHLKKDNFKDWLILFGGVSSTLCDARFAETYTNWIHRNKDSKLIICYENEDALRYRLQKLNKESLIDSNNSSIKIEEKIEIKKNELNRLKKYLEDNCTDIKKIFLVEISSPLYFYSILGDSEIIYTPLLDKRSSDTFSLHIDDTHLEIKRDIVNSIISVLAKENMVPKELNEILSILNQKFSQKIENNE